MLWSRMNRQSLNNNFVHFYPALLHLGRSRSEDNHYMHASIEHRMKLLPAVTLIIPILLRNRLYRT